MKCKIIIGLILLCSITVLSQKIEVVSPNQKIDIGLYNTKNSEIGEWYLKVSYINSGKICEVIPQITLGLSRVDQNFSKELKFLKISKPLLINEQYKALHGKRFQCSNSANETTVFFENPGKAKLNLIIRVYNDGVAFRYEFPEKDGSFVMND